MITLVGKFGTRATRFQEALMSMPINTKPKPTSPFTATIGFGGRVVLCGFWSGYWIWRETIVRVGWTWGCVATRDIIFGYFTILKFLMLEFEKWDIRCTYMYLITININKQMFVDFGKKLTSFQCFISRHLLERKVQRARGHWPDYKTRRQLTLINDSTQYWTQL